MIGNNNNTSSIGSNAKKTSSGSSRSKSVSFGLLAMSILAMMYAGAGTLSWSHAGSSSRSTAHRQLKNERNTEAPTASPTITPRPTFQPSVQPSVSPTDEPSVTPSHSPTAMPSTAPTVQPSYSPTRTKSPTMKPTTGPPSPKPTDEPTVQPSSRPTVAPSQSSMPSASMTPTEDNDKFETPVPLQFFSLEFEYDGTIDASFVSLMKESTETYLLGRMSSLSYISNVKLQQQRRRELQLQQEEQQQQKRQLSTPPASFDNIFDIGSKQQQRRRASDDDPNNAAAASTNNAAAASTNNAASLGTLSSFRDIENDDTNNNNNDDTSNRFSLAFAGQALFSNVPVPPIQEVWDAQTLALQDITGFQNALDQAFTEQQADTTNGNDGQAPTFIKASIQQLPNQGINNNNNNNSNSDDGFNVGVAIGVAGAVVALSAIGYLLYTQRKYEIEKQRQLQAVEGEELHLEGGEKISGPGTAAANATSANVSQLSTSNNSYQYSTHRRTNSKDSSNDMMSQIDVNFDVDAYSLDGDYSFDASHHGSHHNERQLMGAAGAAQNGGNRHSNSNGNDIPPPRTWSSANSQDGGSSVDFSYAGVGEASEAASYLEGTATYNGALNHTRSNTSDTSDFVEVTASSSGGSSGIVVNSNIDDQKSEYSDFKLYDTVTPAASFGTAVGSGSSNKLPPRPSQSTRRDQKQLPAPNKNVLLSSSQVVLPPSKKDVSAGEVPFDERLLPAPTSNGQQGRGVSVKPQSSLRNPKYSAGPNRSTSSSNRRKASRSQEEQADEDLNNFLREKRRAKQNSRRAR